MRVASKSTMVPLGSLPVSTPFLHSGFILNSEVTLLKDLDVIRKLDNETRVYRRRAQLGEYRCLICSNENSEVRYTRKARLEEHLELHPTGQRFRCWPKILIRNFRGLLSRWMVYPFIILQQESRQNFLLYRVWQVRRIYWPSDTKFNTILWSFSRGRCLWWNYHLLDWRPSGSLPTNTTRFIELEINSFKSTLSVLLWAVTHK